MHHQPVPPHAQAGMTRLSLLLLLLALPQPAQAERLAITDAVIFEASGKAPYLGTVIIRDGRIEALGPGLKRPRDAKLLRARGQALLPGLIDVHTHWGPGGEPGSLPAIASRYIQSGVTTVNDFHQQPEAFAPRRAWLAGLVAPHVNFVARLSTPGGHGADWGDMATTRWVSSPETATAAVKALQAYRPDHIKLFADGWRYDMDPDNSNMNRQTMAAAVKVAHGHGQRVLSHVVTVDHAREAALAGVDVIAHSIQDRPIDAETVDVIRRAGTYYAPTFAIYEPRKPADTQEPDLSDPIVRQRIRKYGFAESNMRALHAAGVPVVLGTDAGITGAPHGSSTLHELELMVRAGLSPEQALVAGTATAARALAIDHDRGRLQPGLRADMILVDGRPWEKIEDIRRISHVILDGAVVLGPGTPLPAANRAPALPAMQVAPLIDDFERDDDRTSLDTLRITDMENGTDRSLVLPGRISRTDGGHSLMISARMADKPSPRARVIFPLSRGSVQPVDVRSYTGLRLDLRGAGSYRIRLIGPGGSWSLHVEGGANWQQLDLPFATFKPEGRETSPPNNADLWQVSIELGSPAGTYAWAELDNIGFY